MINRINSWNLYLITDEVISNGKSHEDIAREAIRGGAEVIQLRDKTSTSRRLFDTALAIRKLTDDAGVAFIVNDRLDIALAVFADGLHVGQSDLPASVARRILGEDKILGVSAASLDEAIQAENDGADYLGVGPVFEARKTKHDALEPQGLELLTQIRKHCKLPITAIGGINFENAADVVNAGADNLAIISCIVASNNIAEASAEMISLIRKQKNKWEDK